MRWLMLVVALCGFVANPAVAQSDSTHFLARASGRPEDNNVRVIAFGPDLMGASFSSHLLRPDSAAIQAVADSLGVLYYRTLRDIVVFGTTLGTVRVYAPLPDSPISGSFEFPSDRRPCPAGTISHCILLAFREALTLRPIPKPTPPMKQEG
jgi:hypothetical protein